MLAGLTSIFAIAYRLRSPPLNTPSCLNTSSPENMKHPSNDRSSTTGTFVAVPAMSSSIFAFGSSTLYWSCAK